MIARVFIIFDLTPQSVRALLGTIVGKSQARRTAARAREFSSEGKVDIAIFISLLTLSGRDGRETPETPSTYRGAETRSPLPVVLHEPRIAGSGRSSKWTLGAWSTRRRSRASLPETRSATSTLFRTRVITQAT